MKLKATWTLTPEDLEDPPSEIEQSFLDKLTKGPNDVMGDRGGRTYNIRIGDVIKTLPPRFVDEDQPFGIDVPRPRSPLIPSSRDIRTVLFRRMDRFFLNESPICFKAWQSVERAH